FLQHSCLPTEAALRLRTSAFSPLNSHQSTNNTQSLFLGAIVHPRIIVDDTHYPHLLPPLHSLPCSKCGLTMPITRR
ncbi:hypothetical protein, partial [Fischerella thermalis]|uniref:hypothetical protein n=1 Tax=Fischerella thermalis TaxID=372787 RepID=UPI001CA593A2